MDRQLMLVTMIVVLAVHLPGCSSPNKAEDVARTGPELTRSAPSESKNTPAVGKDHLIPRVANEDNRSYRQPTASPRTPLTTTLCARGIDWQQSMTLGVVSKARRPVGRLTALTWPFLSVAPARIG